MLNFIYFILVELQTFANYDTYTDMTVDDFIRALIPHEHSALLAQRSDNRKHTYHALPAAFKIADQNDDGLISFEEYLLYSQGVG